MKSLLIIVAALTLSSPSLTSDNVLEESVLNEVEHALDMVPTNCVPWEKTTESFRLHCQTNDFFATNGLSKTGLALRLVSTQRSDGRWLFGTNDVTSLAQELLKDLSK